ncbi:hypothetical protein MRX96_013479 [Rhipicephalus microplus]
MEANMSKMKEISDWESLMRLEEFVLRNSADPAELTRVPNIVGVARFSYGFHRTVSPVAGLILDAWLGAECVANICVDTGMMLLLWKETKLVIFWAPVIIGLAFVKLYYTSLLYEFYKIYKSTSGQAYDGQGLVRIACSGRSFQSADTRCCQVRGTDTSRLIITAPAGQSASRSWHPSIGASHTMWLFGNALCHCPTNRWYGHVFRHCELRDDASPGDYRGLRCCDTQADS